MGVVLLCEWEVVCRRRGGVGVGFAGFGEEEVVCHPFGARGYSMCKLEQKHAEHVREEVLIAFQRVPLGLMLPIREECPSFVDISLGFCTCTLYTRSAGGVWCGFICLRRADGGLN